MFKALAKIKGIEYLSIFFALDGNLDLTVRSKKENTITPSEVQEKTQQIKVKKLSLSYPNEVVLPEWLSGFSIDELIVSGKMTRAEKRKFSKQLRKANVGKFIIDRDV